MEILTSPTCTIDSQWNNGKDQAKMGTCQENYKGHIWEDSEETQAKY